MTRRAIYIARDFAELFEGDFEIVDDFLGENVGIREIVEFFEAFVSEPKYYRGGDPVKNWTSRRLTVVVG